MKNKPLILFWFFLAIVSCSPGKIRAQQITDKYWKLIELRGEKVSEDVSTKEAYFILQAESNTIIGNGGCNSFSGTYELSEGNKIRFSKMVSTMMACLNMDIETEYLKVFGTADNFALKGDTLSLNKARMAPLARFVNIKKP
jgi:heat shock protein HslJ